MIRSCHSNFLQWYRGGEGRSDEGFAPLHHGVAPGTKNDCNAYGWHVKRALRYIHTRAAGHGTYIGPRRRASCRLPLMLTGVRNGTCSISWRSGGNHILSGCPGMTAAVVCSPTVPAARSDSRQLYAWQSSASGTDSIQQLQSAAGQRRPPAHTNRPASSTDTSSVCVQENNIYIYNTSDDVVCLHVYMPSCMQTSIHLNVH